MKKRDHINLLFLIGIGFLSIVFLTKGQFVFGSDLDWRTQHYAIPEYFRTLFYSDFNLIPSYAFNLGAGQNIYNFSYYGLFSPLILFSYLLPFIKMIDYIQVMSIFMYFSSIILFYKWIRKRYDESNSFFIALIFLFASPLLFHSHRHIMFVTYMPFLIMALLGIDRYLEKKKSLLLIISTFLLIMTNYFFAVSSLVVLGIYTLYVQIENNKNFKEIIITTIKTIIPILLAVLTASILLIPTAYTLLSGRADANVTITLSKLLTPLFHGMYFMYTPYSLGLTSFIFIVIVSTFFRKNLADKLLSIVFILIFLVPIFLYILNGGMYVNAKVLIPFLPLAMLLVGNFNLKLKNRNLLILIALYIFIMSSNSLGIFKEYYDYYVFDFAATTAVLVIYLITKKEVIFKFLIAVISFLIFIQINSSDKLVTKAEISNLNNLDKEISSLNLEKDIYRFGDSINTFDNLNRVVDTNIYKTTIYSSVSNGYFNNFFFNTFSNEISYRNSAITAQGENIMFNTYMGIRYMINDREIPMYEKEENRLYKNEYALPIIYGNNNLMSQKDFEKLKFPYTNEALLNYAIVDKEVESNFNSKIEKIDLTYTVESKKNITYKEYKNGFKADVKGNGSINLVLDESLKDEILFIKFDMDYNQSCSVGDSEVKINGVSNKLTCKTWKYHNRNYTFEYVISNQAEIKELLLEFSKGHYVVSNIEFYKMPYAELKKINEHIIPFDFDLDKTKGDKIIGDLVLNKDTFIKTSIPFDVGFSIKANGREVEYQKIDDAFLGFELKKGVNKVEITYRSPYLNIGIYGSMLGIILTSSYLVLEKKERK